MRPHHGLYRIKQSKRKKKEETRFFFCVSLRLSIGLKKKIIIIIPVSRTGQQWSWHPKFNCWAKMWTQRRVLLPSVCILHFTRTISIRSRLRASPRNVHYRNSWRGERVVSPDISINSSAQPKIEKPCLNFIKLISPPPPIKTKKPNKKTKNLHSPVSATCKWKGIKSPQTEYVLAIFLCPTWFEREATYNCGG